MFAGFRRPAEGAFDADGERRVSRTDPYGFEMVDAANRQRSRHQSKIYTESNQSGFLQIFAI
jgi:hypothetical protein